MPRFRLSFFEANNVTPPTQEEIDKAIAPYLQGLGSVVYAWNRLHDNLALLFRVVAGYTENNETVAFALWHSHRSDIGQREMLRAAAEAQATTHKRSPKFTPEKLKEICDLVSDTNAHSNRRNEVLHAAFVAITEAYGERRTSFEADTSTGNPKSRFLSEKEDLLREFQWRAEWSNVAAEYAYEMAFHLMEDGGPEMDADYPWPEKPSWPHRDHKKTATPSNPQSIQK